MFFRFLLAAVNVKTDVSVAVVVGIVAFAFVFRYCCFLIQTNNRNHFDKNVYKYGRFYLGKVALNIERACFGVTV